MSPQVLAPASRVSTCFEAAPHSSLWLTLAPAPNGCQIFSWDLLRALGEIVGSVLDHDGGWLVDGAVHPLHYLILRSSHPHHFSVGGDLAQFRACIRQQDRVALREYADACIDLIDQWSTRIGERATSIALIQGRALGGGFEAALAADYIIAEEHSDFGFPEIRFGLFPSTGGMSLLARRVGVRRAEHMLGDPRMHTARELLALGVVDEVCPPGAGMAAVHAFIRDHAQRRRARVALQRGRNRLLPLDRDELHAVVDEWIELAMTLGPDALRVMDMTIRMQQG